MDIIISAILAGAGVFLSNKFFSNVIVVLLRKVLLTASEHTVEQGSVWVATESTPYFAILINRIVGAGMSLAILTVLPVTVALYQSPLFFLVIPSVVNVFVVTILLVLAARDRKIFKSLITATKTTKTKSD